MSLLWVNSWQQWWEKTASKQEKTSGRTGLSGWWPSAMTRDRWWGTEATTLTTLIIKIWTHRRTIKIEWNKTTTEIEDNGWSVSLTMKWSLVPGKLFQSELGLTTVCFLWLPHTESIQENGGYSVHTHRSHSHGLSMLIRWRLTAFI